MSIVRLILTGALLIQVALGQTSRDIQEFVESLEGDVVFPGDSSYRRESFIWNEKRCGSHPAAIVLPRTYTDVSKSMKFFQRFQIRPRIKSGGHSFTGWNQKEDGWVIYTKHLAKLELLQDPDRLVVGAGNIFKSIYEFLDQTGFLFPGGTCPTVGISGYMLGGGQSVISRTFGMGADSIRRMTVVTASGEIVTASHDENSDLFWALRGAGANNYGVVVEFEVAVYASDPVLYGAMSWKLKDRSKIAKVLKGFVKFMETAPKEMSMQVQHYPGYMKIQYLYTGESGEGQEILRALLRTIPKPSSLRVKIGSQKDYVAQSEALLGTYPVPLRSYVKSSLYERLTDDFIDRLVYKWHSWSLIRGIPTFVITSLGGRIAEIDQDESAVMFRQALFCVEYAVSWGLKRQDNGWIDRITRAKASLDNLAPYIGGYVNYVDDQETEWQKTYFNGKFERLQEIKTKWDPEGIFEYEHGARAERKDTN